LKESCAKNFVYGDSRKLSPQTNYYVIFFEKGVPFSKESAHLLPILQKITKITKNYKNLLKIGRGGACSSRENSIKHSS